MNPSIPDRIRRALADRLGLGAGDVTVTKGPRSSSEVVDAQVACNAGPRAAYDAITVGRAASDQYIATAIADMVDRIGVELQIAPNHGPPILPIASAPDRVIAQVLRDIMSELDVPSTKARKVERLHEPSVYWDMIRAAAATVANAALWRREYIGHGQAEAEVPR